MVTRARRWGESGVGRGYYARTADSFSRISLSIVSCDALICLRKAARVLPSVDRRYFQSEGLRQIETIVRENVER